VSFPISPTGVWLCETTEPHSYDGTLAARISHLCLRNNWRTVLDLGCGNGLYVHWLNSHAGLMARGLDGNPATPGFAPFCGVADLTRPLSNYDLVQLYKQGARVRTEYDCILSLETGEHIPCEFESVFLDNLGLARVGLILSWFPRDGEGIGHVNPRPNEWVMEQMFKRGFRCDVAESARLREAAALWWFKESLMVFERVMNK
jgi:hypothetical protein